jgi:hypothetical protein
MPRSRDLWNIAASLVVMDLIGRTPLVPLGEWRLIVSFFHYGPSYKACPISMPLPSVLLCHSGNIACSYSVCLFQQV